MQDTIRVSYRETDILKVTRESQYFSVGSRSTILKTQTFTTSEFDRLIVGATYYFRMGCSIAPITDAVKHKHVVPERTVGHIKKPQDTMVLHLGAFLHDVNTTTNALDKIPRNQSVRESLGSYHMRDTQDPA